VSGNRLRQAALALLAGAALAAAAAGQTPPSAAVYNNLDGDRDLELDRVIKQAYGPRYAVVDTGAAQGYVGPVATRGELPNQATDGPGRALIGYVVVIYLVTAEGRVGEPVVVRSNDARLNQVALDAMAQWRFRPATLGGAPVASTAAQEFTFGPVDVSFGYGLTRVSTYQAGDVLLRRMPPKPDLQAYLNALTAVTHRFFVGDPKPENLDIVVMLRPGRRSRVWLRSSRRPGADPALAPLRALLEAVPPAAVAEGPVAVALQGIIAGGDGARAEADARPVPDEWRERQQALKEPLPYSSDAFMDLIWP